MQEDKQRTVGGAEGDVPDSGGEEEHWRSAGRECRRTAEEGLVGGWQENRVGGQCSRQLEGLRVTLLIQVERKDIGGQQAGDARGQQRMA